MLKYRFYKILRFFHLISKEEYKKQTSKYTAEYRAVAKSKYFDKKWYKQKYLKRSKSQRDPVLHYLKIGWKKGYNPSENFDGQAYLDMYSDVKEAEVNPLAHWEMHGKEEGRINPLEQDDYVSVKGSYSLPIGQFIKMSFLSLFGKILYRLKYKNNRNARILVCLHLYYMEAWPVIKKYLQNLSPYNYDLVVTYIDIHYKKETLKQIKKFKPDTKFYECPNQGFDVGPFIDALSKTDLKQYDIVYKLQSKGTHRESIFIYHQIFKAKDWFFNLYDGILGGVSVHKVIDYLLNNKDIGLVAAENLIITDPKHKQFFTQQIAQKAGIKIKNNYHYVAGTCFACKARALSHIVKKGYTINDFAEARRGEFSFAHGMERIICASIENRGYLFKGIPVRHHTYKKELQEREKISALRLLDDKKFIIDYDFFYKTLETRKIYGYELVNLKIKDIHRRWLNKNYSLKDTSVYAYLQGNTEKYDEYCATNAEISKFKMSRERFDNLLKSVKQNSFNQKNVPVVAGINNIIQDGQHRLCILLDKYGEDHKVKCLKLYYKKSDLPK